MQQASGSTAQVLERLQYRQSVACTLRSNAGRPAREPRSAIELGCPVAVRFKPARAGTKMQSRAEAAARLLPHEFVELEKGAQENVPQHPDACSALRSSPFGDGDI